MSVALEPAEGHSLSSDASALSGICPLTHSSTEKRGGDRAVHHARREGGAVVGAGGESLNASIFLARPREKLRGVTALT